MKSPTDDGLLEYVLGVAEPSQRRHIETALEASSDLRQELKALERVVGDLALALEPESPASGLRQRILETTKGGLEAFIPRLQALFDLSAVRVRELLAHAEEVQQPPWEPGPATGIRLLHFAGGARVASAHCGLVWMAPGAHFPAHSHRGRECILVLTGGAQHEDGPPLYPGDPLVSETGSGHALKAAGHEPLLFAVVLEGNLDWSGDTR